MKPTSEGRIHPPHSHHRIGKAGRTFLSTDWFENPPANLPGDHEGHEEADHTTK